jgi:hypothetical protein
VKKGNSRLALLRSGGRARRGVAGALLIAASGVVLMAGVRMLRRRQLETAEEDLYAESETEIDDRIAESFPASDPPWHP